MLHFEGKPSSIDYTRPLVASSPSQSKIDDAIARLLDKKSEATRYRAMVGERTTEILDAIIYHDMTVELAAIKRYLPASSRWRSIAPPRSRPPGPSGFAIAASSHPAGAPTSW